MTADVPRSVHDAALQALMQSDVGKKINSTQILERDWLGKKLSLDSLSEVNAIDDAGRPDRPELVPPSDVPRRGLGTSEGKAAFIHALAHIEFNAINLALDAVYRFRNMPEKYYSDWIKVAREEAEHFLLLSKRLSDLGYSYGDFASHAGLWDMAKRTADDVLMRMALVPRLLEARGLDVTPGMISRLQSIGDCETVSCLQVIYQEELGHVEIGTHWFNYVCDQRGMDAQQTYINIIKSNVSERIRKPINVDARRKAGFTDMEIDFLEQTSSD